MVEREQMMSGAAIAARGVARALTGAVLLLGCAGPVSVYRVQDASSFPRGIRYVLKRPSYVVGLRVKDPTKVDGNCVPKAFPLQLVVTQAMKGDGVLYEARGREGLAAVLQAFADSEYSITLDASGALEAATTGETDKTLEVVQAIAGIAAKGAALGVFLDEAAIEKEEELDRVCIPEPGFARYVARHRMLLQRQQSAKAAIDRVLSALDRSDAASLETRLQAAALLRAELAEIKTTLEAIQYELDPENFTLSVNGTPVHSGSSPWLAVDLARSFEKKEAEAGQEEDR
jgi:hypothetical protein